MIQRIQSAFLLLAIIAIGLTFIFPISTVIIGEKIYEFTNFGLQSVNEGNKLIEKGYLYIVSAIIVLVMLVTLLQFKNRSLQMKLCRISYLIILIQVGLYFFIPDLSFSKLNKDLLATYGIAFYAVIASIVFVFLAERFIRKDDEMVRSADRIR